MIGVIGGVGPYAGLDLVAKVLDNTIAHSDQEHLPLIHLSLPGRIHDRTEFLMGKTPVNPGIELSGLVRMAVDAGARVIGIPCNTSHVPTIYQHLQSCVSEIKEEVVLVNMVEEVIKTLKEKQSSIRSVGVLATNGTYYSQIYKESLEEAGFEVVRPDETTQTTLVHPAIYGPEGIKTCSNPISEKASDTVKYAVRTLIANGAEAIVLACTELPLVFPGQSHFQGVELIDSTSILARALIKRAAPKQLLAI